MDHTAQLREQCEFMERRRQAEIAQKGERAKGYLLINEGETRQQRRAREREERKSVKISERQKWVNDEIDRIFPD